MNTKQKQDDPRLDKSREKLLEKLDGTWNGSEDALTAIKDIRNHKDTKYGEEIIEDHQHKKIDMKPTSFVSRDDLEFTSTCINQKFLKLKNQISKMVEANKVRTFTGADLPEITVFFKDEEYRGALLIAPRIQEDFYE